MGKSLEWQVKTPFPKGITRIYCVMIKVQWRSPMSAVRTVMASETHTIKNVEQYSCFAFLFPLEGGYG